MSLFPRQNKVESGNVIGVIISVIIILFLGYMVWGWFAWVYHLLNDWRPLG